MNQHRVQIAAIWAISCWPALNFINANLEETIRGGFWCIGGVLAIAAATGTLGHLLLRGMGKLRRDSIILPWTVAIVLFFGYLTLRNGFLLLFTKASLALPPSAGWCALAMTAMFLAWRWRHISRLQISAIIFCVAGGSSAMAILIVSALRIDQPATSVQTDGARAPHANGTRADLNVYYIILDGYAGIDALRNALSYDNTDFVERMTTLGFRDVGREHSNYLKTAQTLGGIFSLEYAHTDDSRTWKDKSRIYPTQFDDTQPPELIARLKADGYSIWFSASIVAGCPAQHVRCVGSTVAVDTAYMTQAFLTPTPLGRILLQQMNFQRNALSPVSRHLQTLLAEHQPMFVFAHHLAPHPPYSLDRNCKSRHPGGEVLDAWRTLDHDGYIEGLQCVNSQVESLVEEILAVDPASLIVLESDHGSGLLMDWESPMASWSRDSLDERSSYLNLVRPPSTCTQWLDRPLGQINTARFVLGCVEGHTPDYLDEHTYISTYALGPERDVTLEWRPRSD